jgi:hypothetical protein
MSGYSKTFSVRDWESQKILQLSTLRFLSSHDKISILVSSCGQYS